nr:MAG TPA: Major head protein [Caudoviricetes sp.]
MALVNILDQMEQANAAIQKELQDKLAKGQCLTDAELDQYQLTEDDKKVFGAFGDVLDGKSVPGFDFKDFLASPSAKVLIPRVIIGTMRQAADPIYLASKFYKKIRLKNGQAVMFPSIGVMRAHDVAEGQEIPEETVDWQLHKNSLIHVGKSGVRIQYSDELQSDLEFDLVSVLLQEAGRAMARLKEQKAFDEWLRHGWTVFDNSLRAKIPEAGTTGLDFEGNLNDTLSIDDLLDLIIAVYNNEYTPTDLIMHPLVWACFARNGLTGSLTAPFDRETKREMPNAQFKLGPESIQGRLPFAFNVNLSPFAPIDRAGKTFDMFCVDANNVGVQIVKDELKTEEFRDPSRDLNNVKVIERYGFGTYNEGRAICSAKNISMAKSYATPERVITLNK